MRAIFGLVLIVGIVLAGGAVTMAKKYITAYQVELQKERQARAAIVPTVEVYVATLPLKYGQALKNVPRHDYETALCAGYTAILTTVAASASRAFCSALI